MAAVSVKTCCFCIKFMGVPRTGELRPVVPARSRLTGIEFANLVAGVAFRGGCVLNSSSDCAVPLAIFFASAQEVVLCTSFAICRWSDSGSGGRV